MAESSSTDFGENSLQDWEVIGSLKAKVRPGPGLYDGYKQRRNVERTCPSDDAPCNIIHPALQPVNSVLDAGLNGKTSFWPTKHTTNEYRFQFPRAGLFQCSVTGLAFKTTGEGEVLYRPVQWEERWLRSTGGTPAGTLFDIKCPQKSVYQLRLPRSELTAGDELSVAHFTAEEWNLLEPLEVTRTYVAVNVTHLSLFGLLARTMSDFIWGTPRSAVRVLLFLRPLERRHRILSVFLLPRNVLVQQVERQHGDDLHIVIDGSCELTPNIKYSLQCSQHEVQPKAVSYHLNYGPNFHPTFEVSLDVDATPYAPLTLLGPDEQPVWTGNFDLKDPALRGRLVQQTLSLPVEERLLSVRSSFVARASAPALNCILDQLLEKRVLNMEEREHAIVMETRQERARLVIDTVRRKGPAASSLMIRIICDADPFLAEHLGLM